MRIAPKPQPGQEITLDKLLGGPGQNPGAQHEGGSIWLAEKSMTLRHVMIGEHDYDIELQYAPLARQKNNGNFVDIAMDAVDKDTFRPASIREFYAILKHLYGHIAKSPSPEYIPAQQAFRKIKELWDQSQPFIMLTEYRYNTPGIMDAVSHNPKIPFFKAYQGELSGNSGRVTDPVTAAQSACEMIFGDNDLMKINTVFVNLIGDDLWIRRLNASHQFVGMIVLGELGIDAQQILYFHPEGFHSIGIKRTTGGAP